MDGNIGVACSLAVLAFVIDLWVGDPRFLPHPVQAVGAVLVHIEPVARKFGASKLVGAGAVAGVVFFVAFVVWGTLHLPFLGGIAALYWAWSGLALGSLLNECRRAAQAIQSSVEEGRSAMQMLVSRDVSEANESELYRALAETVTENLNDGFFAPFFWLLAGGPVGLWMYKTVSTFDSMWGYKTDNWRKLGWAGARLDDALAYIPARITAGCMIFTHALTERALSLKMLRAIVRDAGKMESPNAGWPMAAGAWLHGHTMGGNTVYFGNVKEKPVLGPLGRDAEPVVWDASAIDRLIRHSRVYGIAGAVLLTLLFGTLHWLL